MNFRNLNSIEERPSISDNTLDLIIENTIQTLSNCINSEFNKNSGSSEEDLFCAPSLINTDLTQKIQLARDLTDLLSNCKSKRDSFLTNQSVASLRNYRKSCILPNTQDLLQKIFDPTTESISLTSSQAEDILQFIQNNSLTSQTAKHRMPLSGYQRDLIMVSQKIEEMKKNLRTVQDRRDFLEISNRDMRENIRLLQKQEVALDKKLDDSLKEKEVIKERRNYLKDDLSQSREMLRGMFARHISEQLSKSKGNSEIFKDGMSQSLNIHMQTLSGGSENKA